MIYLKLKVRLSDPVSIEISIISPLYEQNLQKDNKRAKLKKK